MSDAALWREAANKAIQSPQDLNVYKHVPRSTFPTGEKVIGTKWIFKVKAKQTYKARLISQGWNQVPGQDCGSTFTPVCRLQIVQLVLAIAGEIKCEVRQVDVKTVFLYADIEEEVFVAEPTGFETDDKKKDCW